MPAGITTDTAYLQVFTSPAPHVSDPPDTSVVQKGDFDFIRPRTGNVVFLQLDAPALSSTTSLPARLPVSAQAGMAWLARVGLNDAVLRWTAPSPCPTNLAFIGAGSCFSMSTVVDLLTKAIASAATAGVSGSSTVSFSSVSVVSYIPNLGSSLDKPARRVRGVGLVFALSLKARIAVDPTSVGLPALPGGKSFVLSPWHDVTAYLPVALLFESDGGNGVQLTLDPFDLAGSSTGPDMINHLAVEVATVSGDTPVANLIAEAVLNGLPAKGPLPGVTGLRTILSKPLPNPNVASNALSGFFTAARARPRPLAADFEVVLVPAPLAPVGAPVSAALSPLDGLPGADLFFLESTGS
jgi:hypothetical protein